MIIQRQVPGGRLPNPFLAFDLLTATITNIRARAVCGRRFVLFYIILCDFNVLEALVSRGKAGEINVCIIGGERASVEEADLRSYGVCSKLEISPTLSFGRQTDYEMEKKAVCRISLKPNPAVRDPWRDVPVLVSLLPPLLVLRLHFRRSVEKAHEIQSGLADQSVNCIQGPIHI